MRLDEQPFFRLYRYLFCSYSHGSRIRSYVGIRNIVVFVGLLYCYTRIIAVYSFSSHNDTILLLNSFMFLIHAIFVGQSRRKGVINRSEI